MAKKKNLLVQGKDIRLYMEKEEEYFSLTDIAGANDDRPDLVIQNWLRNRNTIEFLGEWERLYNVNFNPFEFEGIRTNAGLNSFSLSVKKWITTTGAIGIQAKTGRYGGTYAHKDIAFAFGYWMMANEKKSMGFPCETLSYRSAGFFNYREFPDSLNARLPESLQSL